jgi:uncharacterized protein (TIGR00251 family)
MSEPRPGSITARPSIADGREGTFIRVRVTPRSRSEEIVPNDGEEIRVRLKALATKGQANAALIRLFARVLGVPSRDVEIVSGSASRRKTVHVRNLAAREVERRLRGVWGL